MHRRKGEVVVGTWGQEVAEKGKLELVAEQARRLVEEVAGTCNLGVVVETCEPVVEVVEICVILIFGYGGKEQRNVLRFETSLHTFL